jgi:IrrE N-terminal-like domain
VKANVWKSAAARRLIASSGQSASVEHAVEITVARLLDGLSFPPSDLVAVAKRVGVVSISEEELPGSGELRRQGDTFEIVYSKDLNLSRRRFTIAHEIGHVLAAPRGTKCSKSRELEALCNKLAAEILMPAVSFRRVWTRKVSISDLFKIAKMFETSVSATAIRAHELFDAGALEVRQGSIVWCKGIPRTELVELNDWISMTLRGEEMDEQIHLRRRSGGFVPYRLQGMRIADQHALFLLTRASTEEKTLRPES